MLALSALPHVREAVLQVTPNSRVGGNGRVIERPSLSCGFNDPTAHSGDDGSNAENKFYILKGRDNHWDLDVLRDHDGIQRFTRTT